MTDVFISYSRKNSEFAHRLIDRLNLANKKSWVDWEGIPLTAPNWWAEIKAGIENADNFVFIISPASTASIVCNMELDYALDLSKRIVPIVYEDVDRSDAFASIADFEPDEAMEERLSGQDPLIIARDNWQRISHINWIFFRAGDVFDNSFATLLKTVETDLAYVKGHTRYLARAREWESNGRRTDLLLLGEEITRAEAWLALGEAYAPTEAGDKVDVVNPLPQAIQRDYIAQSRAFDQKRQRLALNARRSVIVLAVVFTVILFASLFLVEQVLQARDTLEAVRAQVVEAHATVTQAAIVNEIIAGLANTMFQQEDAAEQIDAMNALLERYPNESRAYAARGFVLASQGELEGAIADYTEAIRLEPDFVDAYYNRGSARYTQGDLEGAIADLNQTIVLEPEYALAYIGRGIAHQAAGDLQNAIADFDEAIRLEPQNVEAYVGRGSARYAVDVGGAIADFNQAITLDPQSTVAYYQRGIVLAMQGDFEGATADFNAAIALDSQNAEAYVGRGSVRYTEGDLEGAFADYNEAIALDPQSAAAYSGRGGVFFVQDDPEAAIADFDEAIRLEPQNALAYSGRGSVFFAQDDLEAAIADFDDAIRLQPTADNYIFRGSSYAALGDLESAISDYSEAIRLEPENVLAYINRALAFTDQDEIEAAIADYNEVIRLDPENAEAYHDRANLFSRQGDFDRAMADYSQAIQLDPTHTRAYSFRGRLRRLEDDLEGAIADFSEIIRLDPTDADAYYERGRTYFSLSADTTDPALAEQYRAQMASDFREAEDLEMSVPQFMTDLMDGAATEPAAAATETPSPP
jgi:tetratricopeptide (TPR) repeat protein